VNNGSYHREGEPGHDDPGQRHQQVESRNDYREPRPDYGDNSQQGVSAPDRPREPRPPAPFEPASSGAPSGKSPSSGNAPPTEGGGDRTAKPFVVWSSAPTGDPGHED
jgi:hypothetical protein